jgi:hypothetical protein
MAFSLLLQRRQGSTVRLGKGCIFKDFPDTLDNLIAHLLLILGEFPWLGFKKLLNLEQSGIAKAIPSFQSQYRRRFRISDVQDEAKGDVEVLIAGGLDTYIKGRFRFLVSWTRQISVLRMRWSRVIWERSK